MLDCIEVLALKYVYPNIFPFPNATTCPLWTSWSPLLVVAEV
jgi:hypothetical protein